MTSATWLLVVVVGSLGCASTGDVIEMMCIKGQLSEQQAASLRVEEYETWPSYCAGREDDDGQNGNVDCQPSRYDRVLNGACSDLLTRFEKLITERRALDQSEDVTLEEVLAEPPAEETPQ